MLEVELDETHPIFGHHVDTYVYWIGVCGP